MKKSLLLLLILTSTLSLHSQKDTLSANGNIPQRDFSKDVSNVRLSIYPVPVRENYFTIKADKDVSYVRITNIIGQDIFKEKYSNPEQLIKIFLDNPKRGMYLVSVIFSDGTRIVKKIMIEESE
jgi:hypothetical protein